MPPPPDTAWFYADAYVNEGDEYAWSSGTYEVVEADYGIAHVRATANAGPDNGISNTYVAEVSWWAYVRVVPVDPARAGEPVFFRYRVTGSFEVSGNGHDPVHSMARAGSNWGDGYGVGGGDPVPPNPLVVDEIVTSNDARTLGTGWELLRVSVLVAATAEENGSASAEARYKIELVDVIDENGQIVPIKEICTVSGAKYR